MKYVVVIPARYQSSRLPGKPLIDLCGVPMIIRTYQKCAKAVPSERIYIATDDLRIKALCTLHGIQVLMTSSECLTGTDRVAEVANIIDADIYINLQGDEPLINPDDLTKIIQATEKYSEDVLNGYCEINDLELFRSETIPKVVMRPDGRLLYMSRASIPTNKKLEFVKAWRQVCIYAFPKDAIHAFAASAHKSPLEEIEDIEILRFLELGFDVRMVELSADSISVDTPEDIQKVEKAIQERGVV